jgi:hypothetical protein
MADIMAVCVAIVELIERVAFGVEDTVYSYHDKERIVSESSIRSIAVTKTYEVEEEGPERHLPPTAARPLLQTLGVCQPESWDSRVSPIGQMRLRESEREAYDPNRLPTGRMISQCQFGGGRAT